MCLRTILSESSHCTVQACSCGAIHVTCGPVTLRFDIATFLQISQTMDWAAQALPDPPHREVPSPVSTETPPKNALRH